MGLEARCYYSSTDRSCQINAGAETPGVPNTTLNWFDQKLDHFNFKPNAPVQSFKQRYFVHDKYWKKGGPIFFYCGNEASVELYVNATGLMWENAEAFGAMMVFAEHRYYGETLPFGKDSFTSSNLQWLTMEQALADYEHLIYTLKRSTWDSVSSPVIAFGGSYGGMLASWLRMKYPSAVEGAIAGSAPILAFQGLPAPYADWGGGEAYWQVVTNDATAAAGAEPDCANNIRKVWSQIFSLAKTEAGRATLTTAFKMCKPLTSEADAMNLALMHLNAFDTMAMGNFPYPSNYLIFQQTQNPNLKLPGESTALSVIRVVSGLSK
jgi:lysosomal Pro-X carboxypeptidase